MTRQPGTRIGDELEWLERLIRRAHAGAAVLRDGDIRFVDSLFLSTGRYGADTFISPAQRRWLGDIERRLDHADVLVDPDDPGDAVARPVDEVIR